MSKPRTVKNIIETQAIINQFYNDKHLLLMAVSQLIEREKFRVLNNYLKARGEPLLVDPPRLPGGHNYEWIIPVPQEWISETGRHEHA